MKKYIHLVLVLILLLVLTGCPKQIQIVNQPPTVTEISALSGNITESSNTFTWSGSDTDGTITDYEYRKDSGTWESNGTGTSYTWDNYTENDHTFEVRAKDDKGAYSDPISWSFNYRPVIVPVGTVLVEAGTFEMGNTLGAGFDDEVPVHDVTFTYSFFIGKYEMTNLEYVEFLNDRGVNSNGSYNNKELIDMDSDYCQIGHDGSEFYVKNNLEDYPLIVVSWWGAIEYCNWLSEKNECAKAYDALGNLLDTNGATTTDITLVEGYRLLTEAEWEYAAKGGKNHSPYKYSGSDNPDEVAWYWGNSTNPDNPMIDPKGTHEVGTKQPNDLGIYDMSGNALEWCSDWYARYTSSAKTNPYVSTGTVRVLRGGCWGNDLTYIRVAFRYSDPPTSVDFKSGFRICKTVK